MAKFIKNRDNDNLYKIPEVEKHDTNKRKQNNIKNMNENKHEYSLA